jgi:glycosyltransferase involved in cell wall biosynthesis
VDELAARNIPLTEYPVSTFRSLTAVAQQARLTRHIRRRRIQIVHAYNFYGNVFATPPARLVAPVVIASIRDRAPYLTRMQKRVQRYACQFADCILVNADAVRDWLIGDGYDASKIAVIRNGVDLTRFDQLPSPIDLRRELALPDDTPDCRRRVAADASEGIGAISRGLRRSCGRGYPEFTFWSSAKPTRWTANISESCRSMQARCGVAEHITFTGLRSDVPAVLASFTVSVMPSLNEALSNVVLESMAAGAPTVATRVGGTPEAVVDGVTGILVPPGNAAALADAIIEPVEQSAARRASGKRRPVAHCGSLLRSPDGACDGGPLYRPAGAEAAQASSVRRMLTTVSTSCVAELVRDYDSFVALEHEWNDAVERAQIPHPFLRHEWVRTWWDSFASPRFARSGHAGTELHVIVVRDQEHIVGIAPLMRDSAVVYGLPVRRLALIANDHTPRTDFLVAGDESEIYRAIWNSLAGKMDQWDVLQLTQLPRTSRTIPAMSSLMSAEQLRSGTWKSCDSPYLELAGTWESYWASLSAKFRSNVRNRLTRLNQIGTPALEILSDKTAIAAALDDAWRLEASGWKDQEGTSIASDPAVQSFYTLLAAARR